MHSRRHASKSHARKLNTTRHVPRRIFILGNPDKPEVVGVFNDLVDFAASRCHLVGAELSLDGKIALEAGAGKIIVLGGDGTLLGVSRSLRGHQVPLIGVNLGKLGFLAEFTVAELKEHFDRAVGDETLVDQRMLLNVTVRRVGTVRFESLSVNDCVVQTGPPFRMITLGVAIDGIRLTEVSGDGLIVCTPSGSTGHNLSAGGPIVQAGVKAIVLTPLCPHSLTHRPVLVERRSEIEIAALRVYSASMVIVDGQVSYELAEGDTITIRRFSSNFQTVRNPQHPVWHNLVTKMGWGVLPEA